MKLVASVGAAVAGQAGDGLTAKDGFEVVGSTISSAGIGAAVTTLGLAAGIGTIPTLLVGGGISLISGKPDEDFMGNLYDFLAEDAKNAENDTFPAPSVHPETGEIMTVTMVNQ